MFIIEEQITPFLSVMEFVEWHLSGIPTPFKNVLPCIGFTFQSINFSCIHCAHCIDAMVECCFPFLFQCFVFRGRMWIRSGAWQHRRLDESTMVKSRGYLWIVILVISIKWSRRFPKALYLVIVEQGKHNLLSAHIRFQRFWFWYYACDSNVVLSWGIECLMCCIAWVCYD